MSDESHCPQCGAALPAQSPQGLCPGCLLKWGLESQTGGKEGGSEPGAADRPPPTPEEIAAYFPDLEILELVGRGGMGVVYKARQKRLDRLVALKILAPKVGQDPAFAERFAREARAMAMLSHPHVVAVHDFGQTDGLYYFLMEFVDGVNLRRLLDTGKLAPEEALAIVPQICEALQYAHDHGVVHRDIKPENVLLDKEGRVKIADFGIAKLVGKEAKDLTLTGAGQIIGTPQYMAPEQIEHPLQVDHRADIYSLGVVFYQMLTGELPIGRFAPPSKKVQIDVRLDEVVLRALEKEPERRYQQASEVKTQVESIVTSVESGTPATSVRRSTGKSLLLPQLATIAIVIGIFLSVGAVANFHVLLEVTKTAMLLSGSTILLGGLACLGLSYSRESLTRQDCFRLLRTGSGVVFLTGVVLTLGALGPSLDLVAILFTSMLMIVFGAVGLFTLRPQPHETSGGARLAKWLTGGFVLYLAVLWTILSHDIRSVLLRPSMRNVLQWDHFAAIATALGLLVWAIGILRIKRQNAVRVILSLLLVSSLLFTAVVLNHFAGIVPTMRSLMEDSLLVHHQTEPGNIDIRQHPGGPWIAKLPQGEIELVAVLPYLSKGQSCWQPDGSRYKGQPFDPLDAKGLIDKNRAHWWTQDAKMKRRAALVFRVPEDATVSIEDVLGPTGGWGNEGIPTSEGRLLSNYRYIPAAFSELENTTSFLVAVGVGDWKPITQGSSGDSKKVFGHYPDFRRDTTYWTVSFGAVGENPDGHTVVTVSLATNAKHPAIRIVAVDLDGHDHTSSRSESTAMNDGTQFMVAFANLPPRKIRAFRLDARPSYLVEFHNMALQPQQPSTDEASGTAAPIPPEKTAAAADAERARLEHAERKRLVGTWKVVDLDPIRFFKNLGVPVDGKRETGVPMTREEALATANRQPIVITERFLEPRVEYTLDPTKNKPCSSG